MITNTQSGTNIDEIATGIFRINTPLALPGGLAFSFNQYLIVDDAPMLFHTGLRQLFPLVSEAIRAVLPLERLRYVGLSHFEADECGALNQFLAAAPEAVPVCSQLAAMVSVGDYADRAPRGLADGEELALGSHTIRWFDTPHVPHAWECGLMLDTTTRTFFCGDLFTQGGAGKAAVTEADISGRAKRSVSRWTTSRTLRRRGPSSSVSRARRRRRSRACTAAPGAATVRACCASSPRCSGAHSKSRNRRRRGRTSLRERVAPRTGATPSRRRLCTHASRRYSLRSGGGYVRPAAVAHRGEPTEGEERTMQTAQQTNENRSLFGTAAPDAPGSRRRSRSTGCSSRSRTYSSRPSSRDERSACSTSGAARAARRSPSRGGSARTAPPSASIFRSR